MITLRYLNAAVALSHWGWKEETFQTPPAMCGLDNPKPPGECGRAAHSQSPPELPPFVVHPGGHPPAPSLPTFAVQGCSPSWMATSAPSTAAFPHLVPWQPGALLVSLYPMICHS